eukprot:GFUD01008872.1.p1 GENE.GFUD01008872.1~~GFUD01008872.1.p1  ORF type:complete len:130 (-),score=12.41 GFUD01008872.1:52-441(-)
MTTCPRSSQNYGQNITISPKMLKVVFRYSSPPSFVSPYKITPWAQELALSVKLPGYIQYKKSTMAKSGDRSRAYTIDSKTKSPHRMSLQLPKPATHGSSPLKGSSWGEFPKLGMEAASSGQARHQVKEN